MHLQRYVKLESRQSFAARPAIIFLQLCSLKHEVITLLQLDPSNPINSVLLIVIVIILGVWIAAELRYDGMAKSMIRVVSALVLCVLFMVLMYTSGLIYF